MKRIRVIPVIMLDEDRAVITRRFSKPVYVGDPVNAIRIFNDKEVDEVIILDITNKKKRKYPNFRLIEEMASECFMPLAYGGHVQSLKDADTLINCGIEKISFNNALHRNSELVRQLSEKIGKQSVIASLDVSKNFLGRYVVKTDNASKEINNNLEMVLTKVIKLGIGEIFLNNIDRDGTMSGFDVELINRVASHIRVPLIACGGAGKISDFVLAVKEGEARAVAAGAMFFLKGGFNSVLVNYPDQDQLVTELYSKID